jgi:hypothetical protein
MKKNTKKRFRGWIKIGEYRIVEYRKRSSLLVVKPETDESMEIDKTKFESYLDTCWRKEF